MSSVKALFQPLTMGPIALKNRVFMSALTRNRTSPGAIPNAANIEYYRQRAKGGAGLIITEGILVTRQGTEWPYAPGLWSKEQVEGWKKVNDAIHEEGSAVFAQIWHGTVDLS